MPATSPQHFVVITIVPSREPPTSLVDLMAKLIRDQVLAFQDDCRKYLQGAQSVKCLPMQERECEFNPWNPGKSQVQQCLPIFLVLWRRQKHCRLSILAKQVRSWPARSLHTHIHKDRNYLFSFTKKLVPPKTSYCFSVILPAVKQTLQRRQQRRKTQYLPLES